MGREIQNWLSKVVLPGSALVVVPESFREVLDQMDQERHLIYKMASLGVYTYSKRATFQSIILVSDLPSNNDKVLVLKRGPKCVGKRNTAEGVKKVKVEVWKDRFVKIPFGLIRDEKE